MKFDKLIRVYYLLFIFILCNRVSISQELHPKSVLKNEYGQIFDCVDINLQQSLEHPLLHNHTIQTKPTSLPIGTSVDLESSTHPDARISSVTCPYGTMPVLRSYGKYQSAQSPWKIEETMSGGNHFRPHTAMAGIGGTYYGYNARISIYQPQVGNESEPRFSGAIAFLQNGDPPNTSSLYAGWFVNPHFYGDSHPHLEVQWSDNGRLCTNLLCPGFVQVSNRITPGAIIEPVSVVNGTQYAVTLQVYQDPRTRNWWLAYGKDGHQVGYWPGTIFSYMTDAAGMAGWGGLVQGKAGEPLPPMGSGELPEKGQGQAAYVKDARILVNRDNERVFLAPGVDLFPYVTDPSCYKVGPFGYANGGVEFLFGGPECHDY